ncbi:MULTISPECIES: carbohydrate ABC transporter permease [unclassified Paenibacillus]|uniref:carbohydrate ABC transporter permease n=1 Tax=unclassified Paenibacillus TaxID=185978 RepID=UPI00070A7DFA|nr:MULTISPECIES: sugar ABC transporter permease [unclassified Paenibacillus]KQX57302.1 ABC transporter permease [Paenibacillus sp. Root444D2]KRE51364.1 ABC transporter permease [Paenibacillus sp. Soil724D2]
MKPETSAAPQKLSSRKLTTAFTLKGRWESPIAGYLFISPWLLGFLLLTLWPMVQSMYYSFTKYTLLDAPEWIGLRNYERIFADDEMFRQSLKITILFVVLSVPIKLFSALMVAMVLNKKIKGISVYRTFIYLPSLIGSSIAVAILWQNIFGINGFINRFLSYFGIEGISWISNPNTALGTLIILVAWQFGSSMVIFLAGLKQIPAELYEASSVDGASKVRQFFSITLPMLSPVLLFNLVLQTIGSFQMFTQAFIITKGGPINSTYMYALYLYDRAFSRYEMGYASALAWILLVVIAIVTALIFASSRYWVFYETEGGGRRK